jgi:hypothetical protein
MFGQDVVKDLIAGHARLATGAGEPDQRSCTGGMFSPDQPGPIPLSAGAIGALQQGVREFAADLHEQSYRIARRHCADMVSAADVHQAKRCLVFGRPSRMVRHMGTFGGLLLGAALSNVPTMASSSQNPTVGWLWTLVFVACGGFMVAIHFARD